MNRLLLRLVLHTSCLAIVMVGIPLKANADSPCGPLPVDQTYANGHWFTGAYQYPSTSTLGDVRGDIRTYNPFVANTAPPYRGSSSVWVMLAWAGRFAQIGWAKSPLSPDPYNAYVFSQATDSFGNADVPRWFGRRDPPSVWQYQVSTDRAGTFRVYHNGGLHFTYFNAGWAPNQIQSFGEVWNYTGDQLAGDVAEPSFVHTIDWADAGGWHPAGFGTPSAPYIQGQPNNPNHPPRYADTVIGIGSNMYYLYDARCPN